MDTGQIIYDDHPTAGVITLTTHDGTKNLCIIENEDVESLGLTFASIELTKKTLFREIPILRKVARAYKKILRVSEVKEMD